jgi:hypothetical protein
MQQVEEAHIERFLVVVALAADEILPVNAGVRQRRACGKSTKRSAECLLTWVWRKRTARLGMRRGPVVLESWLGFDGGAATALAPARGRRCPSTQV